MAKQTQLTAIAPLEGFSRTWVGLHVREAEPSELVSVAARHGQEKVLKTQFKTTYGTSLPSLGQSVMSETGRIIWLGPDKYLMDLTGGENINADLDIAQELGAQNLGDCATTSLQSDAWARIEIEGDRVSDVLERLVQIEISERAFPVNSASRTSLHHIGIIILRFSDTGYRIYTARSSAGSTLHAITNAAQNVLEPAS